VCIFQGRVVMGLNGTGMWDGNGMGWDGMASGMVMFSLPVPPYSHPIVIFSLPFPSHSHPHRQFLAQLLPSHYYYWPSYSQPCCQRSYSRPMETLGARLTHPNRTHPSKNNVLQRLGHTYTHRHTHTERQESC